ncbi:serine/threonine-protein kinase [Saccharopolyspora hirsuta]|uniref:non-specific serine/threonine protein kinase n=1 Tax=Saccharopolyspora hirsuta TaxID=1837 RepID=A0A5M7BWH0_SACHI|nr:serine/threonine-protein kinase [Saccharopolyspora hirsuta]KAA5833490.1 serine/threonine protein kinase [Saccharopolyspora hirsuta]MBF6507825.1 serine/threonine protein kinase [Nocardia farcinica]
MLIDSLSSYYYGEPDQEWGAGEAPLAPGELLAPGYKVVDHLRRGSRLDVYDVWSEERSCRCVAKTVRPERADDQRAVGWLRNEGVLLTQFTHPHLVRGYEIVQTAEPARPVVITETLPGHTLSYLIDEHGRLRPIDAAVLGIQLCSVLTYLHRRGWVHLDVKPSNIVEVGGRAVLLDLSLSCRIGERSSAGTFDYLSPEQAAGEEMTPAADTWGLGITLYEALSGTTPWADVSHREHSTNGTRYYPQRDRVAAPLRTHRRLPAALSRTVDACLAPDPKSRPTVEEVAANLITWSGVDPRTTTA